MDVPYGPHADLDEYRRLLDGLESDGQLPYAIVEAASGRPVGMAAYLRVAPAAGTIEIGHLAFSPALQSTPLATEAIFSLLAQVFALGYRRCEWKCHSLNEPSRRAALRFGFTYEGTFRQAAVIKGRNRDTAWFSITDGEWPPLRAVYEQWLDPANFDPGGRQRSALSALTRRLTVSPA